MCMRGLSSDNNRRRSEEERHLLCESCCGGSSVCNRNLDCSHHLRMYLILCKKSFCIFKTGSVRPV